MILVITAENDHGLKSGRIKHNVVHGVIKVQSIS